MTAGSLSAVAAEVASLYPELATILANVYTDWTRQYQMSYAIIGV